MTRWELLVPLVASASPCVVTCEGLSHQGVPECVRVLGDGRAWVRFTDGVVLVLPRLKEECA